MPLDALPGKLVVPTRQQLHDLWLRFAQVRNQSSDTRSGSQLDLDAWVAADFATMVLSRGVTIANGVTRATADATTLANVWAPLLGTKVFGAFGSAGAVSAAIGASGSAIKGGDILTYGPSNLAFQVTVGGTYFAGQPIPIAALSVGPSTNLPAGTILTWQSPRLGVNNGNATVLSQADGTGLSGGVGPETDNPDQFRQRLDYLAANPPASGNDAQYQKAISETIASIQQVFTFPGVPFPGAITFTFTLRPATPGANRIPTATQLAQALSLIAGLMPADDGIFACSLVSSPTTLVLKVSWAQGSPGWADSTLFPLYHASPSLVAAAPNAGGVLSATAFRVTSPAMTEVPIVGQSIAFLDLPNRVFRRKKILTVTTISSTAYDLTVDPTNGISDTSYAPLNGQACCPWSDSLNDLIPPVVGYLDTLGAGEQYATFFDPGLRQRRSPPSPALWPNAITNRLLGGSVVPQVPQGPQQNQPAVPTLFNVPSIYDVQLQEPTVPFVTPVGTPGVSSFLLTLGNLIAFPE